jgi:hypothetical protein
MRVKDKPKVWTAFLDLKRSEVLTSVSMNIIVFWDVPLFSPGDRNIDLPSSGIKSEVVFSFDDGKQCTFPKRP